MTVKERALDQSDEAARRFEDRAERRHERIALIDSPGGLAQADDPDRVDKRLRRLRAYYGSEPVPKVEGPPPGRRRRRFARDADRVDEEGLVLEKIIGSQDYVDVRYFEGGVIASRAVCKVNIGDGRRETGWGTGSLVSPRLLLTNHHVLPDRDTAANSQVEFNFQDSLSGESLPTKEFGLDPDALFVADARLDFALVAVRAGEGALAEFGFNPLIAAEGKAIVGEFVTIVQHPRGLKKRVALRENRIVDIPELFLHYAADTEPGSSGSPVFNDQWEIVGLHHASRRVSGRGEAGRFLNEGVRISRIMRALTQPDLRLPARGRALLDQLRVEGAIAIPAPATPATPERPAAPVGGVQADASTGELRVTIPIEVSVRVPGVQGAAAPATAAAADGTVADASTVVEKIEVDPDYDNRKGYDPSFLGKKVPLPTLPQKLKAKTSKRKKGPQSQRHVIPYHHYSVVLNKERKLAFFTAVNIDGRLVPDPPIVRGDDVENWVVDPRIPEEEQTIDDVYEGDPFDRGHLVRRLDAVWGHTREEAEKANDDTFHWTNAAPQHRDLNRITWLALEKYILKNADVQDLKVNVFTGPVFRDDDQVFQGSKIPVQFWKVVTMVKESGDLSATGYRLSQAELIEDLDFEEFVYGKFRTYQVKVRDVEKLTGLRFGSLPDFDPLEGIEAERARPRVIEAPDDLIL